MSIISFSHVSKKYAGDVTALSEISLDINEGELVFLTGPSGAGKSTLLKLIAGMEKPSGGMLQVSGQDMRKPKRTTLPFLRRKLGLLPGHCSTLPSLFWLMNPLQHSIAKMGAWCLI